MGHDEVIYKLGKCEKCGRFLLYSLKVYVPSPIYDESELERVEKHMKKIEQIDELPCVCGNIAKIIDQTDWFYYGFGGAKLKDPKRDKAIENLLKKHNVENVVKIREPTSVEKLGLSLQAVFIILSGKLEDFICPRCKSKYDTSKKWLFCKNCLEIIIL